MRLLRIAVFIFVGICLGVVMARVTTRTKSLSGDAKRVTSSAKATARIEAMPHSLPLLPPWTGFTYDHSVPQRELLPSDARYDPVEFSKQEEDLSSKEIFEREPRDPVFAPVMEKRIQAIHEIVFHELQLEDKIRKVYIECKTLSCYTTIEVAKSD